MATERLTFQSVFKWNEEQCRDFIASMRWPNGIHCPKCGSAEEPYTITRKTANKNKLQSLYKCRACRRQFSATVGTIFEDSHIPLNKWLAALFLMISSKKGISAHQLFRLLDLGSYRTGWFMAHRIREAMREKGLLTPLSGDVEADETYLHPRRRRGSPAHHERIKDEIEMGIRPAPKRKGPYEGKAIVFGIQERGGQTRTVRIPDATSRTLHPIIRRWIDSLHNSGDHRPASGLPLTPEIREARVHQSRDGVRAGRRTHAEHRQCLVDIQKGYLRGVSPHWGGLPAQLSERV